MWCGSGAPDLWPWSFVRPVALPLSPVLLLLLLLPRLRLRLRLACSSRSFPFFACRMAIARRYVSRCRRMVDERRNHPFGSCQGTRRSGGGTVFAAGETVLGFAWIPNSGVLGGDAARRWPAVRFVARAGRRSLRGRPRRVLFTAWPPPWVTTRLDLGWILDSSFGFIWRFTLEEVTVCLVIGSCRCRCYIVSVLVSCAYWLGPFSFGVWIMILRLRFGRTDAGVFELIRLKVRV